MALALATVLCALPLRAHDANAEMTTAAVNFLMSLTPDQKEKATFDFPNDERKNWHFIPRVCKGSTH